MKRAVMLLLAVLLSLSVLQAANLQKVYTTRDAVYRRVEALCSQAGVTGPSTFSPVPAAALIIALERIDEAELPADLAEEYATLCALLTEDDDALVREEHFTFDFNSAVNLGFNIADYSDFNYGHTDSKEADYDRREDTLVPYRYEDSFLALGVEMTFGDHIYLEGRYDIKNRNQLMQESTLGWLYTAQIPGEKSGFMTGMATEWPYRAGASIGNEYINFMIGRFPHSLGGGITGNLLVGDNFSYQEISNLSLMSNFLTYNISVTRFDQQIAYGGNPSHTDFSRHEFDGMQQFRVVHRFDFNIADRGRIALNLATLYNSHYGFDIRFFYPFVLSHNYYNYSGGLEKTDYDEANNILSLEAEWNIIKGLKASFQIAVDQFQLPWEDKASLPGAYGILGNLEYTVRAGDGTLRSWVEAVYTNPYLYLNGKRYSAEDGSTLIDYNLDLVVGYHMHYMDDFGFSGYVHGPDSIVVSAGAAYLNGDGRFEVGGNILYRIRGMKGIKLNASDDANTVIDMGDAVIEGSSDEFMNNTSSPSGGWKRAEHLLKLALYGIYDFPSYSWGRISTYAALGINTYFNYCHVPGKTEIQPQMMLGVKWTY